MRKSNVFNNHDLCIQYLWEMTWAARVLCFQRFYEFRIGYPGLSLRSNAWAEISERLRR